MLKIPAKKIINQAQKLIDQKLKSIPRLYQDFYHISDILTDDLPELQQLIIETTGFTKFKLSAGTSDYTAFKPYLKKIITDIKNSNYYRSYNNPPGNSMARKAIAIKESQNFGDPNYYNYNDICLTEGTTGAISQVFEYIARSFPKSEVLIAGPTYYLYKYLAKYFNLKYREVFTVKVEDKVVNFETVDDIVSSITKDTKLIVIGQPNNPSNKIYSQAELKILLNICKDKGILLLVDQLFEDLLFDYSTMVYADILADKSNTKNNLVIIKGFSKAKNLAGFRIGYTVSKNSELNQAFSEISEQRNCFAGASNYTGLIILDSFLQSVESIGYKKTQELFTSNEVPAPINNPEEADKLLLQSRRYKKRLLNYYQEYLKKSKQIMKPVIDRQVGDNVAYNTLVRLKLAKGTNLLEFMLNFYLITNTVIQVAPCFAFDQTAWQTTADLGSWMRLSYSRSDQKRYFATLQLLKQFVKQYESIKNKLIKIKQTF